jgi:restriction endonuclease Mrr
MRTYVREEAAQKPALGSPLEDILLKTIDHFAHTKHDFEAVAARVVERIFIDQGMDYRTGWITPKSGDGGYDFVGCIDLDRNGGFPSSRQVVLGQAKCEQSATSGRDIARLAARLRRGWQGAYVTTSTFSRKVQEEVLVDKFPILLVPGMRVASIVKDELDQTGSTLSDYLSKIMTRYRALPRGHDPESVILN